MGRGLVLAVLLVAAAGCSSDGGNAEEMHLSAPTTKPRGNASDQQARGMTEENTRGMGEKNLADQR